MQFQRLSKCTSFSYHILWLLLFSLLLMADSLSAVPHHHPTLSTTIDFQVSFACTSDFILHKTHCYRYFGAESRRAFYHAEKQCAHFHSTLVSLLNQEEEEFVVQLAANNSAFWIGLNDEEGPGSSHTEGVFKWTSGEEHSRALDYENWKIGEPNNRRHLDCVKADVTGWAMATGGCATSKLPFVCKKRACPDGLEWDGSSCDLIIVDSINHYDSSHWLIIGGRQTLILMFLASLIVMVISLLVRNKTANKSRALKSMSKLTNKDKSTRTPLVNRVEDLLLKPS